MTDYCIQYAITECLHPRLIIPYSIAKKVDSVLYISSKDQCIHSAQPVMRAAL